MPSAPHCPPPHLTAPNQAMFSGLASLWNMLPQTQDSSFCLCSCHPYSFKLLEPSLGLQGWPVLMLIPLCL